MSYGYRWIEAEAQHCGCEVEYVKLNRREDSCEVMLSATGTRGRLFGCVLIPGDAFRSAIAESSDAAERMVRVETRRIAQCTKSTVNLQPGIQVLAVGARCPLHSDAHISRIDCDKGEYHCLSDSAELSHAMPERWAWFDWHTGMHVVEDRSKP